MLILMIMREIGNPSTHATWIINFMMCAQVCSLHNIVDFLKSIFHRGNCLLLSTLMLVMELLNLKNTKSVFYSEILLQVIKNTHT